MKHLISQPHLLLSVENSPYPDKVEAPISHEDAIRLLSMQGYNNKKNVYGIEGHYGSPEKSILISDPTEDQKDYARLLSHMTGQESHIESDGHTHKLVYNHGPEAGKVVMGQGTVFHQSKPEDMYSVLPDGSTFTHNFDFKDNDIQKAKEEEGMSPENKKTFRQERKKFSRDALSSELTSSPGVSETGIETRRADKKVPGVVSHGYARVSDPDFHANRAKKYAKQTLERIKSEPKPNLPKSEMEKGLKGDWKNEGYSFDYQHNKDIDQHRITAKDKTGNSVGSFIFEPGKNGYMATSSKVHKDHQRKGIASAAYKMFESKTGQKLTPHIGRGGEDKQSPDAKAIWSNPNRPFGKSLAKGLKGDWKNEGYGIKVHMQGPKGDWFHIRAIGPDGKYAGHARFDVVNGILHPTEARIIDEHQRKGLASAMYQLAEQHSGMKIEQSPFQSKEAEQLWSQPNRPFGKSQKGVHMPYMDNQSRAGAETRRYSKNPTRDWVHGENAKREHKKVLSELKAMPKPKLTKASLPSTPKVNLNPEHGKKIADAYHNMKHDPNNPEVKAAYGALIDETKNQFKDMLSQGFKFSKIKDENPYKTSKDVHADLKQNKHLHFFPTESGYGSGDQQTSDHPMLQPTEFMHEGKPLLANDLFRIVHDYRGHHLGGESGFGPKGEHQAYLTHKKDYSPLAAKALASETLGQNSWVNYGPHGEANRKNPAQTIYAEQKAGLLPDEIINGRWHE